MPHERTPNGWLLDEAPSEPRTFRRALGSFPTGVTVITCRTDDGRLVGLTANSFSSVSLDPALVLWSLVASSPSRQAFESSPHFAINVLSDQQGDICSRFAKPVEDKFQGVPWREGLGGLPLIEGAVAQFECQREAVHPGGDHIILLGRVMRYRSSDRSPLVFCNGRLMSPIEAAPLSVAG